MTRRALRLLAALSAVVAAAAAAACNATFGGAPVQYSACHDVDGGAMRVLWRHDGASVDTLFVARAPGWAALGWNATTMVPADAVIAYRTGAGVTLGDFALTGRSAAGVRPGTAQALNDTASELQDGAIAARFRRPLGKGPVSVIWAIGPESPNAPTFAQHTARGAFTVDFGGGSGGGGGGSVKTTTPSSLSAVLVWHGILMFVAWAVLTPTAELAMRFLKRYNPTTFRLHRALNILAVLLTAVAFIMGAARGSHTDRRHLGVGVTVMILALAQAALGIFRPDKMAHRRAVWYIIHAWTGTICISLGWLNVAFGLIRARAATAWIAVFVALIALHIVTYIALTCMPGRFPVREQAVVVDDVRPEDNFA